MNPRILLQRKDLSRSFGNRREFGIRCAVLFAVMGKDHPIRNVERRLVIETRHGGPEHPPLFAGSLELTNIVLLSESQIIEAEDFVVGCEQCTAHAEISFDYLLDALTGSDPSTTEYLMPRPAKCPECLGDVTEKTLVIPA